MSAQVKAEIFEDALSPMREAAAYEALWSTKDASVKNIAHKIKNTPHSSLSQLISSDVLEQYTQEFRKLAFALQHRFEICCVGEADYPQRLLDAKHPVPLLYYRGAWDLVSSPSLAIVGTREPSDDGIKRTKKLVQALVKDGYTIISGLARGIDTIAHQTAIECDGHTIAVIGTPISEYYPRENRDLQEKIAKEQLVISQIPFIRYSRQTYHLNRFFFPERNKTMSALSLGTIIVEAGNTSGSLIQAQAALEQGRKLFILDSCFHHQDLTWPEKFSQKGAIRVKDYQDIQNALTR